MKEKERYQRNDGSTPLELYRILSVREFLKMTLILRSRAANGAHKAVCGWNTDILAHPCFLA